MKVVIFDFNGTLLWDTQLHNRAWDQFLEKHGIQISDDEKDHKIHGRLNSEILKDLFGDKLTMDIITKYSIEKELIYQDILIENGLTLAKGVVELFDYFKKRSIPMAIATASGKLNVDFYIKIFDLHHWFESSHIVYNDGSMRGKPYPDIFEKAINILGAKPEDVIILEDSIAGIKAAEAAGAGEIIIVNSCNGNYENYSNKYLIIDTLEGLKLIGCVDFYIT